MRLLLDSIPIHIDNSDPELQLQLDMIFQGWPMVETPIPTSPPEATRTESVYLCDITITIQDVPPPPPATDPFFQESAINSTRIKESVTVFKDKDDAELFFEDGALARIRSLMEPGLKNVNIDLTLSRKVVRAGRLEDILFSALAPVLRRFDRYLVHGFAAATARGAILLVGPSKSGKTTAGLSLVSSGMGYLANDVVLLRMVGSEVYALPTPGVIGISAKTLALLPVLRSTMTGLTADFFVGKKYLAASDIVKNWSRGAPVRTICLPHIENDRPSQLNRVGKAVTLARIMESSIDRWDSETVTDHIRLLQNLVEQADLFVFESGDDIEDWRSLLSGRNQNYSGEIN